MGGFITFEKRVLSRMREMGCRMTPQTMLIVRYIFDNDLVEIDPESLYYSLKENNKISLMTIYRVVKRLSKWGFIRIQPRRYFVIW
jgi:Fe2+ or Zn2+ uptake regulation protein